MNDVNVSSPSRPPRFDVRGLPGIPEVRTDDDLAALIAEAVSVTADELADGDIVVVTSKIVSKAEGRVRHGIDRDDAIDEEAVRTVTEWTTPRGRTRIVETRHGLVMAAAGVDASNVDAGSVVLLPVDPDASARRLRAGLRTGTGAAVGVIVTDTAGRAWRDGVVDLAIGAAGVRVIDDLRGHTDGYGNDLGVTVVAVADEIAAATELVRTKLSGVPVAVVRGLAHLVLPEGADDPGAAALVRPSSDDRFRLGTPDAMRAAVLHRREVRSFTDRPVAEPVIRQALASAASAPRPSGTTAWDLNVLDGARQKALAAAMQDAPGIEPDAAEAVRSAAVVIVPALLGSPAGTAEGTTAATLALGAAVENVLVTLAADGIGGSWIFPTPELRAGVRAAAVLPDTGSSAGVVVLGYPSR